MKPFDIFEKFEMLAILFKLFIMVDLSWFLLQMHIKDKIVRTHGLIVGTYLFLYGESIAWLIWFLNLEKSLFGEKASKMRL